MFIKVKIAEPTYRQTEPLTFFETYVDAGRIGFIREDNEGPYSSFVIFDGDSGRRYLVEGMDAAALVEAAILARLNPAICLPPHVGKDDDAEPSSTGSLHWKANDQQPRKKNRT